MTPSFVPCRIPPLALLQPDVVHRIFTACSWFIYTHTGNTQLFQDIVINEINTFRKFAGGWASTINCLKNSWASVIEVTVKCRERKLDWIFKYWDLFQSEAKPTRTRNNKSTAQYFTAISKFAILFNLEAVIECVHELLSERMSILRIFACNTLILAKAQVSEIGVRSPQYYSGRGSLWG